jgi:thiol-disulfide isomerase/thioredoxin
MPFAAWVRGALSAALIAGVAVGAFGRETKMFETRATAPGSVPATADEGRLPDFSRFAERGAWLNSGPLTSESLRGKVVLVDFWTYSCINSLRNLPYMKSWAAKYKDAGLVVIGVHTPEFSFEKDRPNVVNAVREARVTYPVVMDSEYKIWNAFNNEYWPADYVIDGKGRIRYHHFGEGDYGASERVIVKLLEENGASGLGASPVRISASGIEAPPGTDEQSPETYVGSGRAENRVSPLQANLSLNQWGLAGDWSVGAERAVLERAPGRIVFRFHSRDLHVVLGPAKDGKPVRFAVKLDGAAPGDAHGVDSAPDGTGEVREPRLYQLIRQKGPIRDRTFEIDLLDAGVHAYVFTFG